MKNIAVRGLVGGVILGSMLAMPAEAQLKDISKTAGKLAERVMGKSVSSTAPVSGTAVSATVPNVGSEKSARVTLLDKQTNRRQTLVMIAGEAQTVGMVQVTLTKCLPDYAAVLGQDVAWLEVLEGAGGSGRSTPWFAGWMFNTYPEVSTLDHPRYDIQLQGCGVKARQVVKAGGSAPVLDSEPVGDTETTNDVPAGTDPYVVPGVKDETVPVAPAAEQVAPTEEVPAVEAPAVDTEAPATEAAVEPQAGGAEGQQDLHKMMDSGTY